MFRKKWMTLFLFVGVLAIQSCAIYTRQNSQEPMRVHPSTPYDSVAAHKESFGREYSVSTQGEWTAKAAQEILKKGGNVIDAFVAASFTSGVERPHSTGLAGGGFLLYRQASSGKVFAVDFLERSPHAAKPEVYLKADGSIDTERRTAGVFSVAVPAQVRGVWDIHKKFGKLSWAECLKPAIRLAETGYEIYPRLAESIGSKKESLAKNPTLKSIFLKADGTPKVVGDRVVQKDLASTLKRIAQNGVDEFYSGSTASKIKSFFRSKDSKNPWINDEDLKNAKTHWLEPLSFETSTPYYPKLSVYSMPMPSSGGIILAQFMKLMNLLEIQDYPFGSLGSTHRIAYGLQSGFLDRGLFLGNTENAMEIQKKLISDEWIQKKKDRFKRFYAYSLEDLKDKTPEHLETTHFSIIDKAGNMISSSQSINAPFGAGETIPDTGIILNNSMDNFSVKVGDSNTHGTIGSSANLVAPGKVSVSAMSPTLVLRFDTPVLSLGAPGGSHIPTCVAQVMLNYLYYQIPFFESVAASRIHHQASPDTLDLEKPYPSEAIVKGLKKMGYTVKEDPFFCVLMGVSQEGGLLRGVADPRDSTYTVGE